ncbi:trypsin-like peptidase domain-containing protein [Heliobacterium chlorum]|uniref:Trypsin-like peptidase domain-containing protein n=1 Tax=Heliobacterium chlorum TaxID=2698 RepID=A0ABR7T1H1_HELCL|nr:trypsin-like peptidase domain-containing protein [Heliobacterium chlorum]MBC9783982.1 trypsin-like peptidase domain-containing protein [Heliobacterium chlorum]
MKRLPQWIKRFVLFMTFFTLLPLPAAWADIGSPYPGINYWPIPQIAKSAGPAVVSIANLETDFWSEQLVESSSGSGVIIDAQNGYIVTNNHVVEGAKALQVGLADGRTTQGRIIGRDPRTDLAVVKIDSEGLTSAPLGNSDTVEVGELVVAIGNPLGKEFARTVTHGIISATDRTLDVGETRLKVLQTDAAINPGNSGGGLFNMRGELIGINSAKIASSGVEGMGFAIPINVAKPIVQQLIEQGHVARPWLGVSGLIVTEAAANYYDLPRGFYIKQVVANSPAAKCGLQRGDIITKVDDNDITTMQQFTNVINNHAVGDTMSLIVYRNGETVSLQATLEQSPYTN